METQGNLEDRRRNNDPKALPDLQGENEWKPTERSDSRIKNEPQQLVMPGGEIRREWRSILRISGKELVVVGFRIPVAMKLGKLHTRETKANFGR